MKKVVFLGAKEIGRKCLIELFARQEELGFTLLSVGRSLFSFAIFNEDKEFGVSIHKIDEGIDSGDIAFERCFKIPPDCFVNELVELANAYGLELFVNALGQMIKGEYYAIRREFHLRDEINALKVVNLHSCGVGGIN